jgi:hypothetical protein
VVWRSCRFALLALLLTAGCALFRSPEDEPVTLGRYDFIRVFENYDLYTDVWYMGSDSVYHHFCMEHWTFKPNKKGVVDAVMDRREFYQVDMEELPIPLPFALTKDEDQWRLLRPKRLPNE